MNVVEQTIQHFGGLSAAARAFEVDRQVVHSWRKRGYIPPRYAYVTEEVTGGAVTAKEVIDGADAHLPRAARVMRVQAPSEV
jgi:hypothetical protein